MHTTTDLTERLFIYRETHSSIKDSKNEKQLLKEALKILKDQPNPSVSSLTALKENVLLLGDSDLRERVLEKIETIAQVLQPKDKHKIEKNYLLLVKNVPHLSIHQMGLDRAWALATQFEGEMNENILKAYANCFFEHEYPTIEHLNFLAKQPEKKGVRFLEFLKEIANKTSRSSGVLFHFNEQDWQQLLDKLEGMDHEIEDFVNAVSRWDLQNVKSLTFNLHLYENYRDLFNQLKSKKINALPDVRSVEYFKKLIVEHLGEQKELVDVLTRYISSVGIEERFYKEKGEKPLRRLEISAEGFESLIRSGCQIKDLIRFGNLPSDFQRTVQKLIEEHKKLAIPLLDLNEDQLASFFSILRINPHCENRLVQLLPTLKNIKTEDWELSITTLDTLFPKFIKKWGPHLHFFPRESWQEIAANKKLFKLLEEHIEDDTATVLMVYLLLPFIERAHGRIDEDWINNTFEEALTHFMEKGLDPKMIELFFSIPAKTFEDWMSKDQATKLVSTLMQQTSDKKAEAFFHRVQEEDIDVKDFQLIDFYQGFKKLDIDEMIDWLKVKSTFGDFKKWEFKDWKKLMIHRKLPETYLKSWDEKKYHSFREKFELEGMPAHHFEWCIFLFPKDPTLKSLSSGERIACLRRVMEDPSLPQSVKDQALQKVKEMTSLIDHENFEFLEYILSQEKDEHIRKIVERFRPHFEQFPKLTFATAKILLDMPEVAWPNFDQSLSIGLKMTEDVYDLTRFIENCASVPLSWFDNFNERKYEFLRMFSSLYCSDQQRGWPLFFLLPNELKSLNALCISRSHHSEYWQAIKTKLPTTLEDPSISQDFKMNCIESVIALYEKFEDNEREFLRLLVTYVSDHSIGHKKNHYNRFLHFIDKFSLGYENPKETVRYWNLFYNCDESEWASWEPVIRHNRSIPNTSDIQNIQRVPRQMRLNWNKYAELYKSYSSNEKFVRKDYFLLFLYFLPDKLLNHETIKAVLSSEDSPLKKECLREVLSGLKGVLSGNDASIQEEGIISLCANFVQDTPQILGLPEEDEVMQLALDFLVKTTEGGPKDPLMILKKCREESVIQLNLQPQIIRDITVMFNASELKKMAEVKSIPRTSLHLEIDETWWKRVIQDLVNKVGSENEAKENIYQITGVSWIDMNNLVLAPGGLIENAIKNKSDTATILDAKLNAILFKIYHESTQSKGNALFSPQEECLLKTFASIAACPTGIQEGILNVYQTLDEQDRIANIEAKSSDLFVRRAESFLKNEIESFLVSQFSKNEKFLNAVLNENDGWARTQLVHQSGYLKNMIAKHVGLPHQVKYDGHTHTLSDKIIQFSKQELVDLFFTHVQPEDLIRHLKEACDREYQYDNSKVKGWGILTALLPPEVEDMIYDESTEDEVGVTEGYLVKLLIKERMFVKPAEL